MVERAGGRAGLDLAGVEQYLRVLEEIKNGIGG